MNPRTAAGRPCCPIGRHLIVPRSARERVRAPLHRLLVGRKPTLQQRRYLYSTVVIARRGNRAHDVGGGQALDPLHTVHLLEVARDSIDVLQPRRCKDAIALERHDERPGAAKLVAETLVILVRGIVLRDPGGQVGLLQVGVRLELLERYDPRTGFTAMERTTGYPAAVTAADLAMRRIPPGARTPERLGYGPSHLRDLRRRGLRIRRSRLG